MNVKVMWCLLLLGCSASSWAEPIERAPIKLGTNISSLLLPNQLVERDQQSVVECIFNALNQPLVIVKTPWRRAYQDVRNHSLDGYFTAIALSDTSRYGGLSEPIAIESWHWMWASNQAAPVSWRGSYKIGSILGSQQALWLVQEGFDKPIHANNLTQLVKMLFSKRVDAILVDSKTLTSALSAMNIAADSYQTRFFRYMPLSVFFGNHALAKDPALLVRFNQAIPHCTPSAFSLSADESARLIEKVMPLMGVWRDERLIKEAITAQNEHAKPLNDDDIKLLDQDWSEHYLHQAEYDDHPYLLTDASRYLHHEQGFTRGLVTEMMAMDRQGYIAAISQLTSDYYQGDEEHALSVIEKKRDAIYISSVYYDLSTHHFQVQVAVGVFDENTENAIGSLTVAFDIEAVLSLDE